MAHGGAHSLSGSVTPSRSGTPVKGTSTISDEDLAKRSSGFQEIVKRARAKEADPTRIKIFERGRNFFYTDAFGKEIKIPKVTEDNIFDPKFEAPEFAHGDDRGEFNRTLEQWKKNVFPRKFLEVTGAADKFKRDNLRKTQGSGQRGGRRSSVFAGSTTQAGRGVGSSGVGARSVGNTGGAQNFAASSLRRANVFQSGGGGV